MNSVYLDIGKYYKKFIIEKIKDFTNIEVIIIGIFQWLNKNKYDNDLTVSYLHIHILLNISKMYYT